MNVLTHEEIEDLQKAYEKKQAPYKRMKRPAYQHTALEAGKIKEVENENKNN